MKENNKEIIEEVKEIEEVAKIEKPNVPYEVLIEDTKEAITRIINVSELPVCFVALILSELSTKYDNASKEITRKLRDNYNKQLDEWKNQNVEGE